MSVAFILKHPVFSIKFPTISLNFFGSYSLFLKLLNFFESYSIFLKVTQFFCKLLNFFESYSLEL